MKMLIPVEELKNKKSREFIALECIFCKKTHYRQKNLILRVLNGDLKNTNKGCFCSKNCCYAFCKKKVKLNCKICNKEFEREYNQYIKFSNSFCSSSCAAIHNNKNKKYGYRRSKLEKWIEEQLISLYPNLDLHFNRTDAIKAELDIYIPNLKLAFELNGIVHYKPIFGEKKFLATRNKDSYKIETCLKSKIDLHIIDVYNNRKRANENNNTYLDKIISIINAKVADK